MENGEIAFITFIGIPLLSISILFVVFILCRVAELIKDTIDYCKR